MNNTLENIRAARKETNTNPTEKQIEAENYKKGTFWWNGLMIKLENPKGSKRSGTDKSGNKWSCVMKHDYGYIGKTKSGADGDAVDVFIGNHPESEIVYVIDQVINNKFDEHKVVIGALTEEEAKNIYLANYEKGWKCGPITALTIPQFKEWIKRGKIKDPLSNANIIIKGGNMSAPVIIKSAVSPKLIEKTYFKHLHKKVLPLNLIPLKKVKAYNKATNFLNKAMNNKRWFRNPVSIESANINKQRIRELLDAHKNIPNIISGKLK
jgi:hypothetical protein